ncbi:hypothetical protein LCGC14_2072880 [marine sediment metagenome]|uniref:Guanylate cyclase domain-containing protein n=1 Tax=marine sediment metagenome TaxID=412755 RepID=A0A0F9GW78_9ZZZZ
MPSRYNGSTLVAFTDISGFKKMMRKDSNVAYQKMRAFYNIGYTSLFGHHQLKPYVEGLFFSDCGILFVRDGTPQNQINNLLNIIKQINREILKERIMLTTSIAYGEFSFANLKVHNNIQKTPIYGRGYLNAYLNAEVWSPKMEPGQCRITLKELPNEYKKHFENNEFCIRRGSLKLQTISSKYDNDYLYYYWMLDKSSGIKNFEERYTESYKYIKRCKYLEMLKVLQDACKFSTRKIP